MSEPPTVPADSKDWTFVIDNGCPQCGFRPQAVEDTGARLRSARDLWRVVLQRDDATLRPEPQIWSATEYACHIRDVCILFSERLDLMLTHDDPEFRNWDQDATAIAQDYFHQDPAVVLTELSEALTATAEDFDAVGPDQWDRPGRRSNGSTFTVGTFAVYLLHDVEHHGWDVTR